MMQENIQFYGQETLKGLMSAQLIGGTFEPQLYAQSSTSLPLTLHAGVSQNRFNGRFEVSGLKANIPEQEFTISPTPTGFIIESVNLYPWPQIKVDLAVDSNQKPQAVRGFHINPANNTADAEILYTRLVYALLTDGNCTLWDVDNNRPLKLRIYAQEDDWFFRRAQLCRKLKYIEDFFDIQFFHPEQLTARNMRNIEMVFRGITEGDFTMRQSNITFYDHSPSVVELSNPPFTRPGPLTVTLQNGVTIFDKPLNTGPVIVHVERCEIASPRLLESLRIGEQRSTELRFSVLDHQVGYQFLNYAELPEDLNLRSLQQFREKLLREEPKDLVDLLSAPVEGDVTPDEAMQIVSGWLEYNRFPDRYCPQAPSFTDGCWTVPIWVAYPGGVGGWVEDACVDLKTGTLTLPISAEEMRQRGKAVAEKVLSAR